MEIATSTVHDDGDSISTSIPLVAVRHLGIKAGDVLQWIADERGGYRVIVIDPRRAAVLNAHGEIIEEYVDVFRDLAT
ncbi:MAG TPA: hypothetical protein VF092_30955 [Longimicrobium sp.]